MNLRLQELINNPGTTSPNTVQKKISICFITASNAGLLILCPWWCTSLHGILIKSRSDWKKISCCKTRAIIKTWAHRKNETIQNAPLQTYFKNIFLFMFVNEETLSDTASALVHKISIFSRDRYHYVIKRKTKTSGVELSIVWNGFTEIYLKL